MEQKLKLYMVLLGCTPQGRLTEQHDIFFGIGTSIDDLVPDMYKFWHNGGRLHVDSWREVTTVNGYEISVTPKSDTGNSHNLFFLNLGGYKPGEFEEYHYKTLVVAQKMDDAIKEAEQSSFYKQYNFKDESHIDNQYALDIDDLHNVTDILAPHLKEKYSISIKKPVSKNQEDKLHIGYLKLREI